jgi:hypothetical protein
MHQFKGLGVRPHRPQSLNEAEAQTTATVNRKTAGFVHDEDAFVLEQNASRKFIAKAARGDSRVTLRESHRGDSDAVTRLKTPVRLGAAAVHPHFATPNNAVNKRTGRAFQPGKQEIVETLARIVRGHFDDAGSGRGFGRFFRHAGSLSVFIAN